MPPNSQSPAPETGGGTRTTLSAPIQNLDHIDRELTYRQRLNRPFKVIQNLPVSTENPDYSKLAHPLSIKDSGVIHNALIVSRFNWCHYLFRAYWTRKEQYIPINDNKKRDRTAKLCTCQMKCGPHTYDVKFFILKDEEREKQHIEEQERKREERQKRKQEREEAQAKRQEELKLKVENGAAMPVVSGLTDINIINENNKDTKAANGKKGNKTAIDPKTQITPAIEIQISTENDSNNNNNNINKSKSSIPKKPQSTENINQAVNQKTTKDIMSNPEQAQMITNLNLMAKSDSHLNTLMKKVASGGASVDQISEFQRYIQKAKDMSKGSKKDIKNGIRSKSTRENGISKTLLKPMNSMSKKELQEESKRREQEVLKRAEEMRRQQEQAKLEKVRLREEKEKEKLRIKQLKAEKREKIRLEKEKMKKQAKEERERFKSMKKSQRDAERERDQLEKMEKKMVKLKEEAEQDDDIWNDKLTIFQERYAKNASLIFEFNENTTARFFLPNDAIFELIDNEDITQSDQSTVVKEEAPTGIEQTGKSKSPYVTILASFLIVHNQAEIDGWERRLAEKKRVSEQTEEEKRRKRKKTASWTVTKRITRHSRQVKAIEAERDEEENYHEEDEEFEEHKKRPIEVYSCSTITLSKVPFRYANLIMESGNDYETSKSNIETVMKRGKKLPQSWIWNEIDGIKDEILGETLRFNLQRLDYINGGGKLKGKLMMKKLIEIGEKSNR